MTVSQNIASVLGVKTVGIAGAGGLGSNVAPALVRSGIGKLIIADYDTVSESNLNRQFYFANQIGRPKVEALRENLLRINPRAAIAVHHCRITEDNAGLVFGSCDVVVEAFDKADEKKWFVEWMSLHYPEKPLVMASGIAGWGNMETLRIQRSDNVYICGDQTETEGTKVPLLAPRVTLVAMMQANIVVDILLKDSTL